jgi:protease-4
MGLAWLMLAAFVTGCSPLTMTLGGRPEQALMLEVVSRDGHVGSSRVAIVDVSGTLLNSDAGLLGSGENPVSVFTEQLQAAGSDPAVVAVLIRVNSPGGTVTASDAMYREVVRFKQHTRKPVVVLMMDVAASGGYYLACAGDHIIAYPTTVTGSIGVIMQTVSLRQALDSIGVRTEAIVSGPNKATGSMFETLQPAQRALLQAMVDEFYGNFVNIVTTNRPGISPENLKMITDGRVFTGRQAVELGLVDELGDIHDAIRIAAERGGAEHVDVVRYRRAMQRAGTVYGQSPTPVTTQINLAQINIDGTADNGAVFYYIWKPLATSGPASP